MIKKYLIIILVSFILPLYSLASESVFDKYETNTSDKILNQSTYKINAIDPTLTNNWSAGMYPGLRGANQLIIYTSNYGISTGTNEYGGEAIVKGNRVVELSGADSLIPTDGVVISAHGNAKTWLNKNITVGTKIYVDRENMKVTAVTSSSSYIFQTHEKINEANAIMNYYKNNTPEYNSKIPKDYLMRAKYYLKKAERNTTAVQQYSTLAMDNAKLAMATAIPYKESEVKGIWLRPTNTTESGIIATLDYLKKTGINNVFLETFYHGYTIFPSATMKSYGFTEQNPAFTGIDPLKIWLSEAHKRGIKIHIWFESFYTGNKPLTETSILTVKPEWSNVNFRGIDKPLPVASVSEHNGYFLDPANPDVQIFLTSLITEIIKTYHPDGINLDYIRYPQSVASNYSSYTTSNWGYTQYARDEFKLIYGEDPANLIYGSKMFDNWSNYRRDKITMFIASVSKICRDNKTTLTAVVFPNRGKALETKQQDWVTWSNYNYIDAFTPLFLTCDPKSIKAMIFDMMKEMSPKTKLYAGLFVTFMGGSEEDLIRQIHETRKLNLGGVILFDYAHLQEKYIRLLSTSIFSNPVITVMNAAQKKNNNGKKK
jgi:uncharacterized lipoprotein YddW (UPF0748 family)